MRLFSKAALRFDHPSGDAESVRVRPLAFADVPDWVRDSSMFKLASGDETVSEVETKSDEKKADKKAAEKSNVKEASEAAKAAEGTDVVAKDGK